MTKRILSVVAVISCLFSAANAFAVAITINYDHAGLSEIRVEAGRLHYVWHTQRKFGQGELAAAWQDMTNYDRHEVDIWLTGDELASLVKWMDTHKVLELPANYPSRANKTYGSAFQTTLSVTLEDRKHSMEWNGDSVLTEDIQVAERELLDLCGKLQKDRDK